MTNVAVVRGISLNKWEMQNFEPLTRNWDVIAYGAENGSYPIDCIQLPVRQLRSTSFAFEKFGVVARVAARFKIIERPSNELVGLEKALVGTTIVHAAETAIPFSEQAICAKLHHGNKVVLTCWETIPFAYEEDPVIHARCRFVREHTDLFLATTQRAARALEIEGVAPERIQVVMPGVDTQRFQPAPRAPELMADYGVDKSDIVLLFIGRLIREKGLRELLAAFSLALRALPQSLACRCRLLIAGRGDLQPFIDTLITDLNLADNVRVVGGMDYMQIHRLHQLADVFVLPSIATPYWEEQYGMVLVEAMACGKPVLSTHTGGIPEVVGDAGLLVAPLEPDALAEALLRLIRDQSLREELGYKARARVVEYFDAANVAGQIGNAYKQLIASPSVTVAGTA